MKYKLTVLSFVISIFLIVNTLNSLAQTDKGNWLTEGNFGNIVLVHNTYESIANGSTYETKSQSYSAALFPRLGYFVAKNIVVGVTLNVSGQKYSNQSYWDNGVKSNEFINKNATGGILPFVRYYLSCKNPKNKFYVQAEGGINIGLYNRGTSSSYSYTGELNGTSLYENNAQIFSGNAVLGFNHFFTPNIAFNTAIGYNYGKATSMDRSSNTYLGNTTVYSEAKSISETNNLIWNFGFTIILSKK